MNRRHLNERRLREMALAGFCLISNRSIAADDTLVPYDPSVAKHNQYIERAESAAADAQDCMFETSKNLLRGGLRAKANILNLEKESCGGTLRYGLQRAELQDDKIDQFLDDMAREQLDAAASEGQ
jgi:hypothetical protein